jgi:hypothetical protein
MIFDKACSLSLDGAAQAHLELGIKKPLLLRFQFHF